MKTFLVLISMAALLVAAQCNTPSPAPPAPVPAPSTTAATDAAPPPAPSDDRCSKVVRLVTAEGCTLPAEWLDSCRVARAHGATFHLGCFEIAKTCEEVANCETAAG